MFENVVVGVKVDQDHEELIRCVREAAAPGARVHVVTLVRVGKDGDEPRRRERAKDGLERLVAPLAADGYDTSCEVEFIGVAAGQELLRIAEERDADLIAVGLGKRSRVGKALLGSDAQAVIVGATCPVIMMRLGDEHG
ncbi:MAG: universal stress protein [Nitriliruptoraceae bacterium]|nr:universal stress protein [Nitriliruptoraceae bacterium]